MKLYKILSLGIFTIFSGCSSVAVTYDAAGQVIGSCKATRGLLSTATAICHGNSNEQGVDYNVVDKNTGLLQIPPSSSSISIQ